jgi:hypothetical protein
VFQLLEQLDGQYRAAAAAAAAPGMSPSSKHNLKNEDAKETYMGLDVFAASHLPDLPGGVWRLGLYRADLKPWLALGLSEGLRGTALAITDPMGEHLLELPVASLEEFEAGRKFPEAWLDLSVGHDERGSFVLLEDPTDRRRAVVSFLAPEEVDHWRYGSGGKGEGPAEPIAVMLVSLSDVRGTPRALVLVHGGRADELDLPPGGAG